VQGKTKITGGISSDFAFAKMASVPSAEIDLLVEDEVAKTIVLAALPTSMRSRAAVHVIGSATALARQLAALHIRSTMKPTIAVFDGDQRPKESSNFDHARSMCEKTKGDFAAWFSDRIDYLPGDTWPEAWLIQRASENVGALATLLTCDAEVLSDTLEYGLQAGKHNEFFEIAKQLGMDRQMCLQSFTMVVCSSNVEVFKPLVTKVEKALADAG
jgi:hypothetical protein